MNRIRVLARKENRTLSEVVNILLGEGLQRRSAPQSRQTLTLPTYAMGQPRVHLGDRNALEALMDS